MTGGPAAVTEATNHSMKDTSLKSRDYWLVASVLIVAHTALFVRDTASSESFLRADRAQYRMDAIQTMLASSHDHALFIKNAVSLGIPGDYAAHAIFYAMGGRLAVIGFQSVLAILAAVCVTYIAGALTSSRKFAVVTGLVYGLLPQSLAFPHLLLSEGMANPFIVFGTAAVLKALRSNGINPWWIVGGAGFGIAALIRPGLLLLPIIALLLVVILERRIRVWPTVALGLIGLAPFLLWCSFMFSQTGKFGPGESTQDLNFNYSFTVAKVLFSKGLAPGNKQPEGLPYRIPASEFLRYVRTYPGAFAKLYVQSFFVMTFDSGFGRLYVDLLGIGANQRQALQDPGKGWRAQMAHEGFLSMAVNVWRVAPGTLLAGLLGGALFVVINIGLVVGYWVSLLRTSPLRSGTGPVFQKWLTAFLLVVPIYVLVTSLVVPYGSSRHRSQGEFAWIAISCIGWAAIATWRRSRTLSYPALSA